MSKQLAIIGCGYWGKNLVRNFYELGVLKTICDTNITALNNLATQFPGLNICTDADSLFQDPTIKGVVIASPAVLHFELAQRALQADKDVFVEKPLALKVEEGEILVRLARQKKRILMVGHILHYHPAVTALKLMMQQGTLGQLQYIYSNRLNFGKIRREENSLWSFAPHDISVILGLINALPETVSANGHAYLNHTVADVTLSQLTFANNINAHVFVSWLHPFKEQKLVVVGSKKMAVFDDTKPWAEKLMIYSHEVIWPNGIPEILKDSGEPYSLKECEPLKAECSHFVECIQTRNQPLTDGEEGLRGLKVLSALQQSLDANGKTTSLAAPANSNYYAHESAFVDHPSSIGKNTKIWHFTHILANTKIGERCSFGQNCVVGPNVIIGNGVKVQNNVSIYEGIEIEDDVFLGPSAVFTNVINPRSFIVRKQEYKKTLLKKGCSIGANATIVCGVTIGEYAFIGAGAVITKDVSPYALMVGVPARPQGWVSRAGNKLIFDQNGIALDSATGEYYQLQANSVSLLENSPYQNEVVGI